MLLLGLKTGWQEGGRESLSTVCPLTGPLFLVVFPRGQFWGPFCLPCTSITWTSVSPKKESKFTDDTKLVIEVADPGSVRALRIENCSHWRMAHVLADAPLTWTTAMSFTLAMRSILSLIQKNPALTKKRRYRGYHHGEPQELCAMYVR